MIKLESIFLIISQNKLMKNKILLILLISILNITTNYSGFSQDSQQKAFTFSEAKQKNINIDNLDKTYKLSTGGEENPEYIYGTDEKKEEFANQYYLLIKKFANFILKNDLILKAPIKLKHSIYFNYDGTIDYFLYEFEKIDGKIALNESEQKKFNKLLNEYLAEYQTTLISKQLHRFSNSVTFRENTDEEEN
jgi:hypothetical protein